MSGAPSQQHHLLQDPPLSEIHREGLGIRDAGLVELAHMECKDPSGQAAFLAIVWRQFLQFLFLFKVSLSAYNS